MTEVIVIAGGIGSGKSVVCRVLECMGFRVYDCDSRAKSIMDNDITIKRRIEESVSPRALRPDLSLDRGHIAEVVFSDKRKLSALNTIVHGAVREDIKSWISRHAADRLLFIETAIPKSSGLDKIADALWIVDAPAKVRIQRVCVRSGLDPQSVASRIEAQKGETELTGENVSIIDNSGACSVLLQIDSLLRNINGD